jgi:DNA invertase Pin-like site-specific DNA recombinase
MRVALYTRVSTNEQRVEMQLAELREYCQRRGWEIIEEYSDAGMSGARESRPALNRLMADARRRRWDGLVVYRYDRLSRSLRQLVNTLCEFDALGIHFVSLHEGTDTSTPNGRLIFGIFASIAEFERDLIRSRVRSGLAAARARGQRLGRPQAKVDVELISQFRSQGLSWPTIAEKMGVGTATAFRAYQRLSKNFPQVS